MRYHLKIFNLTPQYLLSDEEFDPLITTIQQLVSTMMSRVDVLHGTWNNEHVLFSHLTVTHFRAFSEIAR